MRHGEEVDDNFWGSSQWFSQWWLDDCWMLSWTVEQVKISFTSPGLPNATLAMTCRCFCHSSPGSLHQMSQSNNIIVGCYNMRSWNLTWNLKMVISKFGIWSSRGPPFSGSILIFGGVEQWRICCEWSCRSSNSKQADPALVPALLPPTQDTSLWESMASWPNLDLFNCHMGVSKNRGKNPKMDGLFHGKPY